ncbi:MAG: chromosome segregation protein SMC [Chloroflexota bacterium]
MLHSKLLAWHAHRMATVLAQRREVAADTNRLGANRSALAQQVRDAEQRAESRSVLEREWNTRATAAIHALHDVQRRRDAVQANVEGLRAQRSTGLGTLADIATNRERTLSTMEAAEQRLAEIKHMLVTIRAERQNLLAAISSKRMMAGDQDEQTTTLRREHAATQAQRERAEQALARDRARLRELHDAHEEDLRHVRSVEERQRVDESEVAAANCRRHVAIAAVTNAVQKHERAMATLHAALDQRDTLLGMQERLRSLIRRARTHRDDALRALTVARRHLAALDHETGQSLLSSLQVHDGWEEAIASALGSWAYSGLSQQDALRFHEMEDAQFDTWRQAIEAYLNRPIVWADTLVEGVPPALSHPLHSSLVVETASEAEEVWSWLAGLPALKIATPPLQVVARTGVCFCAVGIHPPPHDNRVGHLLELRRSVRRLERRERVREQRLLRLEPAGRNAEVALTAAQESVNTVEREARELSVETVKAREQVRVLDHRIAGHSVEAAGHQRRVEEIKRRSEARATQISDVEARMHEAGQVLASTLDIFDERTQTLADVDKQRQTLHDEIRQIETRDQVAAAQESAFVLREKDGCREIGQLHDQEDALRSRETEIQSTLNATQLRITSLEAELTTLNQAVADCAAEVEQLKKEQPTSDADPISLTTLRDALSTAINQHERSLARAAQAEESTQALVQELERDLGIDPSLLPESPPDRPSDDEIRRLRARAAQYADADDGVVQEYGDLQERQSRLEANVADLQQASGHLKEIVEAADREMRKQFKQAFDAVNEEFGRVFEMMVRGGSARLEQLPDTGGIEIHAQLPGRRPRASAAFSGGERSLIASALLFGALRIRPTPFCILDEVDAALDESNVDRYLTVLRDLSSRTQVIVVTHNRATMSQSDAFYGLTMDGEGVSSTLSLKLEAYNAVG